MTTPMLGKCRVCGKAVEPFQKLCDEHAGALLKSMNSRGTATDDVWVMVCEPRWPSGRADSHLVAWKGEAFESEVESIGSTLASDYGLDDVPGPGLWVLEGKVKLTGYRCNRPDDPEEWDTSFEYEGKWRKPMPNEMSAAVRGYAPGAALKPPREFPPVKHACPECLNMHWRPEEREKVRERWETCASCAQPVTDDYMLHDEVWLAAGMKLGQGGGVLHLRCVEKRIERSLTLSDFADVSINNAIRWAWERGRHSLAAERG